MKVDQDFIEKKHKVIISKGIKLNKEVKDKGHGYERTLDIIDNMLDIFEGIPEDVKINPEVCMIAGYWLDVGRNYTNTNPEKISADMLVEELKKENYDKKFIKECYEAVIHHRWNTIPNTLEGYLVRDADKISFIGIERWKKCITSKHRIDATIKLLSILRNELLYFNVSKKIYDEKIIDLVQYLYDYIFEK